MRPRFYSLAAAIALLVVGATASTDAEADGAKSPAPNAAAWRDQDAVGGDAARLPNLSVDLHAHLFMKAALGWFFDGAFADGIQANSWDDRLSSKIDAATLDASGVGVVVVSLIGHPVYRGDMRQAVRDQIALAEAFAERHDGWAIARSPSEARSILLSGRRAMVLSLEGASGVLECEEDLREFVDEKGIRIVTELHLVDDRFGGAATLNGFQYFANPSGVIDQLLDTHADATGVERNRMGLSPMGKRLAIELIKRGVWLDLTHASDAALDELVPIVEAAGHPLLVTHTGLRSFRPAERSLSDAMLERIGASRGIVGLLPSEDALAEAPRSKAHCPATCSAERCEGSVHAFAEMYTQVARVVGADAVMLGSDYNGGMRHLGPACGTGTELDREPGLFHAGQTAILWDVVRRLGAPVPSARAQLARFLDTWERVVPADLDASAAAEGAPVRLPSRVEVAGPSVAFRLSAGMSGGNTRGEPAIVAGIDVHVRKDHGGEIDVEPIVYLIRVGADVHVTPGRPPSQRVPFAEGSFAPVGVRVRHHDNLAAAEALRVRVRRHDALDQELVAQVALLRGVVRTMPGLLKRPGRYNLFVQLDADLLGYKHVRHLDAGLHDTHAAYIGGGELMLGLTLNPIETLRLSLYGGIGSDFSIIATSRTSSFSYQSDIDALAGISFGTADRRWSQFFEAHYLANRELHTSDLFLSTPQYRGGVSFSF